LLADLVLEARAHLLFRLRIFFLHAGAEETPCSQVTSQYQPIEQSPMREFAADATNVKSPRHR
jgi:hypothetical protein